MTELDIIDLQDQISDLKSIIHTIANATRTYEKLESNGHELPPITKFIAAAVDATNGNDEIADLFAES